MRRPVRHFLVAAFIVSIAVMVTISYALDPILRARIQHTMNLTMKGHRASLDHAHLSLLGVLSLRNLTIIQSAHPSAPIVHVADLRISIQWRYLLLGQVVVDCLISETDLRFNLIQLNTEASGQVSFLPRGWQDALQRLHRSRSAV